MKRFIKRCLAGALSFAMAVTMLPSPGGSMAKAAENSNKDSLLAEYSFADENVSDTVTAEDGKEVSENATIKDISGNNHDAAVKGKGATIKDGVLTLPGGGKDSGTAYVDMPTEVFNQDILTISLWLKDQTGPNWHAAMCFGEDSNNYMILAPDNGGDPQKGHCKWEWKKDSEADLNIAADATSEWAMYTTVITNDKVIAYRDGVYVGEINKRVKGKLNKITMAQIGGTVFPDTYYKGDVYDVKVYGKELNQDDIKNLYFSDMPKEVTQEEAQKKHQDAIQKVLERDAAALSLGNTTAVSAKLELPTTGANGSKITWTSNDTDVISATGEVKRPEGKASAKATLTANIAFYEKAVTKEFEVTVLGNEQDLLAEYSFQNKDFDSETKIIKDVSGNGNDAALKGSGGMVGGGVLTLPGGGHGTDAAYVEIPGKVFESQDTLTVNLWLDDKTGNSNHAAMYFGDPANGLGGNAGAPTNYGILVPSNPDGKCKFEWGRDGQKNEFDFQSGWGMYTMVITSGKVTVYHNGEQKGTFDKDVSTRAFGTGLVAAIGRSSWPDAYYKGDVYGVKVYNKTFEAAEIKGWYESEKDDIKTAMLNAAANALDLGELSAVSANLTLPTTGINDTTISWESSNANIISTTGTVVRPDGDGTTEVTLTATIARDNDSVTKEFVVTVFGKGRSLLAEYIFDSDHVDGRTIKDASGNGKDAALRGNGGTVGGGVLTLPGGAKDSGTAYVDMPTGVFKNQQTLTISLWLRDQTGPNWHAAMCFGENSDNYMMLAPDNGDGEQRDHCKWEWKKNGKADMNIAADATSEWAMYTTVITDNEVIAYRDGKQMGQAITKTNKGMLDNITRAEIGGTIFPDVFYKGDVYGVKIYNKVFEPSEIEEWYNTGKSEIQLARLNAVANALDLGNTSAVSADLELPGSKEEDIQVSWESSNDNIISADDGTAKVTRPDGDGTAEVTLKATVTYKQDADTQAGENADTEKTSVTKEFTVTVFGRERSLLAEYAFDSEHIEGNTIKDLSENGRDATLEGSGGTMAGGILTLPGGEKGSDAAYVNIPGGVFESQDTLTVNFWLDDKTGNENHAAMYFGDSGNGFGPATGAPKNYGILVPSNPDGKCKFEWGQGGPKTDEYAFQSGWGMYTMVITAGKVTVYHNGVQTGTFDKNVSTRAFGTGLVAAIGRSSWPDAFYKGDVYGVKVYNKTFEAADIQTWYTNGQKELNNAVAEKNLAALLDSFITLDGVVNGEVTADITLPNTIGTGTTVTWASTNDAIKIETAEDGTITGKVTRSASGQDAAVTLTATITYKEGEVQLEKTKTFEVTVPAERTITSLALDKEKLELEVGGSKKLIATVDPSSAASELVWSSDKGNIAAVTGNGAEATVTGKSVGTATITVMAGDKKATCTVEVKAASGGDTTEVTSLTLDKEKLELKVDGTETLTATVDPSSAASKLTWSSNKEDVAEVTGNGTSATVRGKSVGTATITVEAGGKKATCTVEVKAAGEVVVTSLTLDKEKLELKVDGTETLTATVDPSSAASKLTWSSNKEDVAEVTGNGTSATVKGKSVGTATITVEAGGKKATCTVEVKAASGGDTTEVTSLTLDKEKLGLEVNGTQTLTATVDPLAAASKLTWSSNKEDVAEVTGNGTSATVRGKSVGTATITVEAGGKKATCAVEVKAAGEVVVTSLTLDKEKLELKVDGTETLTATVDPEGAALRWSSDKEDVAEVTSNGTSATVRGKSVGTATITVMAGDKKATCTVEVKAAGGGDKADAQTPNITAHPANATYTYSQAARALTVAAQVSDGGRLSYQWFKNTKNSVNGATAIARATSASYNVPTNVVGTVYYFCRVTNTIKAVDGNKTAVADSKIATVVVKKAANPITKVSSYKKAVGSKLTLKPAGAATYKTSNKKIVTVSKTGKVVFKSIGKATITVRAKGNANYNAATKKISITVTPKKAGLKSAKSSKSKTITVKWKKDKSVTGYEIQYSLKSSFKGAKTKKVKKNSTTTLKLSKLKGGKQYYVRVREYKNVKKKPIYGDWSKAKKVKVKK